MPEDLLYYIQQKIFFQSDSFLIMVHACPNLEDIKDVLFYKFMTGKEGNTVKYYTKTCEKDLKNSPG